MTSTYTSISGPLTTVINCLPAVALASGAIYTVGPWSAGDPSLDFAPMLAPARQTISGADLALCHGIERTFDAVDEAELGHAGTYRTQRESRVPKIHRASGVNWKVAAIEALPTFVDLNPDIRLVDLERRLADPGLSPGRRRIYEAAEERIGGNLLTRGATTAGLIVRGTREPH